MGKVDITRSGLMLVLSSPSGAGKTTLSHRLLDTDNNLNMSISVTTRSKRPGEKDGQDYAFVSSDEFERKAQQGDFLEHAIVHGHRYGTPRQPVEEALAQGKDILFDIDWQGTQQLNETALDNLVKVFILPPSWAELEERLKRRAQDPPAVVVKRMAKASDEISHWPEYDYVIVNDDLDRSQYVLEAILAAERARRWRQIGLADFVKTLME